MIEIQPPNSWNSANSTPIIFLGGSIEMGTAENWQERIKQELADYDVILLNPRRDDWDSSIKQSMNEPRFTEQVNWELDGLEAADTVIFYFDPNTKAPITLMELGLMASTQNIIVCCPDGFWRKGNVEIVCGRYNIPLVNDYEALVSKLTTKYRSTYSKLDNFYS